MIYYTIGLFDLAWYPQDPSTLSQMARFHSALWMNSIL